MFGVTKKQKMLRKWSSFAENQKKKMNEHVLPDNKIF